MEETTIEDVEAAIPDDRKHIDGLAEAMEEADRIAHEMGNHDHRQLDDCPLCSPKEETNE